MEGEEAVNTFALALKSKDISLMSQEEALPLSFIGAAAVSFYKAKVKVMKELGMAEDQRKATLADGQDAGECLLRIEARIGELLPSEDEVRREAGGRRSIYPEELGKNTHSRRDRASKARIIHRNPKAVERVIAEAKKNEDIPTRTAVLNRIRIDKLEQQLGKKKVKELKDINEIGLALLRELGDVVAKLPSVWLSPTLQDYIFV